MQFSRFAYAEGFVARFASVLSGIFPALCIAWLSFAVPVFAQSGGGLAPSSAPERSVSEWLMRMHEASRKRAYVGTFVVSSAANMASARIWHVCDGEQQIERIESLTGAPRSTFRRNDEVITFRPDTKIALVEKRDTLGIFPSMLKAADLSIGQYYTAKQHGAERVAGLEADIVHLDPKDSLRYGYRVWSEKKSGLVIKLQTLDTDGRVLEQAAYSDLQLDAPVSMAKLSQMMGNVEGYKIERPDLIKTNALAEGWLLKAPVVGFKPMSCYKRMVNKSDGGSSDAAMQWIFSDGLASVSIFAEGFDRNRHVQEGTMTMGATRSLTRLYVDKNDKAASWWLTVVGEVPVATLIGFVQGLERRK
jgi:sigma-E factor negative regulatory protein RseB